MSRIDAITSGNEPAPLNGWSEAQVRLLESLQELNFLHLLYFWSVAREGSIAGACERLGLSQPTISMQIRKLEKSLGHQLFDRSGRSFELSEVGRTVYDYADDMFSLGRELLGTLRGLPGKRSGRLHVGVPMFLPRMITYRLLQPVLELPQPVQLICHQAEIGELITGLERHRFDLILTDTRAPLAAGVRSFCHPLGDCEIAFCGTPALAKRYRSDFPNSLADAPLLLPTVSADLRRKLDRWLDDQTFGARIVGEFDDSALMKEFAAEGAGIFPIPAAVAKDVERQYRVEVIGCLPGLKVKYYAVTTERKLSHPATVEIVRSAKSGVLHAS